MPTSATWASTSAVAWAAICSVVVVVLVGRGINGFALTDAGMSGMGGMGGMGGMSTFGMSPLGIM